MKDVRTDFPLLTREINNKPIIYLDSTATSLKPTRVIDAVTAYNSTYTANIFRGIYTISEEATEKYENARAKVASFIGATRPEEVVFTRNATESINLVSYAWGTTHIKAGDTVVTTIMEHHSNFVPWQQLGLRQGYECLVWNMNAEGELSISDLDKLITRKTKLFTITAVSNVLGTINPIESIVKEVKKRNPDCLVLVDAAQAVPHMKVDVKAWGADFVVFSSHKMLGPTGVGVLWAKYEHLLEMSPFLYGGEMITEVHVEKTLFKDPPHKFEAGTPDISGVIGLGAAVEYLTALGMDSVREHEKEITKYAMEQMSRISGLTIVGPTHEHRGGVVAFTLKAAHAHDIAQILNEDNICIRSGNHCAMPLHTHLHIPATARASFYVYTTKSDIDKFIEGLIKVQTLFA
jgi:cysteine desulfurase/selenocysteine lyase